MPTYTVEGDIFFARPFAIEVNAPNEEEAYHAAREQIHDTLYHYIDEFFPLEVDIETVVPLNAHEQE